MLDVICPGVVSLNAKKNFTRDIIHFGCRSQQAYTADAAYSELNVEKIQN